MTKNKPNVNLELHCQVDEKDFSRALFLCRLFVGTALIYLALGSLLYWREFMVNVHFLSLGPAVPVALGLAGAELFIGLFLILGWYTRVFAAVGMLLALVCTIVFFAGKYNAVFVAMCLLLCASLSVLIWLGAGAISLDYKRSQRKLLKFFRGSV